MNDDLDSTTSRKVDWQAWAITAWWAAVTTLLMLPSVGMWVHLAAPSLLLRGEALHRNRFLVVALVVSAVLIVALPATAGMIGRVIGPQDPGPRRVRAARGAATGALLLLVLTAAALRLWFRDMSFVF